MTGWRCLWWIKIASLSKWRWKYLLAAAGVHIRITYASEIIPKGRTNFRTLPACGRLGKEAESKAQRKWDGNWGIEAGQDGVHLRNGVKHFCPFCLDDVFCLCPWEGMWLHFFYPTLCLAWHKTKLNFPQNMMLNACFLRPFWRIVDKHNPRIIKTLFQHWSR